MSQDHYRTLGLHAGASHAEIKTAFRRLALAHHPDRHGGSSVATARFHQIISAYKELLRTPEQPEAIPVEAPPEPPAPRQAVASPAVDVTLLGAFLCLVLAGLGVVAWQASKARPRRPLRATRLR